MYKKLSYDELLKLKSKFFDNLKYILTHKKYSTLKDYLTITSRQWWAVYHMMRQDYIRRTVFERGTDAVIFFDEREKIELHADKITLAKMQSLLWDAKKLAAQTKWSQSIEQTLQYAFESGELSTIEGKSYLVYDIETSYATNDLKWIEFYLWYAYIVEWGIWTYKYLDANNMPKFVEFMLNFDGYIIWFNSLAFDNPVSLHHALKDNFDETSYQEKLSLLNKKSLDIYQFALNLTGKRMWLNRLSRALVWLGKTLESGKEWENLWKLYQEWDEKALQTLKEYCKNDVKMTYLLLWYILYYKKLSLEWSDFVYSIEQFLEFSNVEWKELDEQNTSFKSESMFS